MIYTADLKDELIAALTVKGATIYRKSGAHYLYIVPEGESHSAAWRAVMEDSQ